jgi:hypothetical protein
MSQHYERPFHITANFFANKKFGRQYQTFEQIDELRQSPMMSRADLYAEKHIPAPSYSAIFAPHTLVRFLILTLKGQK